MNRIDRGAVVIGLLFIAAGTLFLLESLDVMTVRPGVLWPILVIGFGIGIALGGRPRSDPNEEYPPPPPADDAIWK
jgi:hypothetical protein